MLHQKCFLRFNTSKPRQLFAVAQKFFLKTVKKRISVRSYTLFCLLLLCQRLDHFEQYRIQILYRLF